MYLLAIGTNDCITYNNAVTKNKIPSLFLYLKNTLKQATSYYLYET